ncbi:hypothetical protein [Streptomyces sp. NPDC050485]|uniref:hypothetical protein n=1 Tax=Streptomyces sp. NPDC050485 TaxID=3365617 RepID=UPI0037A0BB56
MDKARLYENGDVGPVVFAHQIDDEPWWRRQKTPLICAFCMTPVVSQRTTVGRAPRGALFRLAKDQTHGEICPLNPTEVLQKIAHGSQGVAVIEGDELHLVLPGDLGQIGTPTSVTETGPAAPGDRFGVNISTVRPLLPPLINSAVVIARFLQRYDYDADVVAQFKVRRPGETRAVGWGEFCHGPGPGDQARLYARLTGGRKPGHPVAVYGRITAVEKDRRNRKVLRLADGPGFTVRIRSDHNTLLEPLKAGVFVLAVGHWKVWTPPRGRPELQMYAEEHWQLAHWTYDDASGRSGPPACPPPLSLAQRTLRQARKTAAAPKPAPRSVPSSSPKPHPSGPSTSVASPPVTLPPLPPAAPPPAVPEQPTLPPGPDTAPVVPAPPAHPPLSPRPPASPQRPADPPRRRTRRGWWPFGRRH